MGVFLILDSTRAEDFARGRQMLEITRSFGLPVVIIANKQDCDGVLTPDDIRGQLDMPETIPVMPAVATTGDGVFEAFETLIDMVMEVGKMPASSTSEMLGKVLAISGRLAMLRRARWQRGTVFS